MFSINYHIVLITKNRRPVFIGPIKDYIESTIREISKSRELLASDIDVYPDHIRLNIAASPMESPYSIVKALKNLTWSFLVLKFPEIKAALSDGLWSSSYYIVTVEEVDKRTIDEYVAAHNDSNMVKLVA
ncbi:IS200/IS605 family transposase [Methanooceanicella nereidis]|uniref:IS200/IS605 family transposase n=1 Tax=Methanooceanicella nereidis TaxID=2052831 RepID=UPI001E3EF471